MTYHNTLPETRENVKEYAAKAQKQDELILALFRRYPLSEMSPDEIHGLLYEGKDNPAPITSVRRAMTDLSRDKDNFGNPIIPKLIKSGRKKTGKYGRLTNCWKLNLSQGKLF